MVWHQRWKLFWFYLKSGVKAGAVPGTQEELLPWETPLWREGGSCCPTWERESWKNMNIQFSLSYSDLSECPWTNPTGSHRQESPCAVVLGQPRRAQSSLESGSRRANGKDPSTGLYIPTCLASPTYRAAPPRLSTPNLVVSSLPYKLIGKVTGLPILDTSPMGIPIDHLKKKLLQIYFICQLSNQIWDRQIQQGAGGQRASSAILLNSYHG